MKTKEFLLKVRAKIEAGWTQFAFANNENGVPVSSSSHEAKSYCFVGAMRAVASQGSLDDVHMDARIAIKHANPGLPEHLSYFNDRSNKEQVLAVVDNTIRYLEENEHT